MFKFLKSFPIHHHFHEIDSSLKSLMKGRLWLQILIGLVLGILAGIILGPDLSLYSPQTRELVTEWLALPGYLFLTLVQMIIVPLIIASVIKGIGSTENIEQLKKIGVRIVFYFLLTTAAAITIGIGTAHLLNPGSYMDSTFIENTMEEPLSSFAREKDSTSINWAHIPQTVSDILPANPTASIVNQEMLQIVIFALFFGLAMVALPSSSVSTLYGFFEGVQSVTLKIVNWAMKIAPLAVFGLITQIISKTGVSSFLGIGMYMGTVVSGLFLLLLFYLLLVTFLGKRNPFRFLGAIREVQIMAFSTSSSAAVMPLSMKTAEEKLKVPFSLSQFLIPLGTTINMDGTALYQGVATVFLAQVFQIDLSLGETVIVLLTAIGASIGTPATPGVGIIILSSILISVGIPPAGIALIIGVDRILDMMRTSLNVTGDLVACVVMTQILKGKNIFQKTVSEVEERVFG